MNNALKLIAVCCALLAFQMQVLAQPCDPDVTPPEWDDTNVMIPQGTCGVDDPLELLMANLPTGTDNCPGDVTVIVEQLLFELDCFIGGGNSGSYIYSLTLTDDAGNQNTEVLQVLVNLQDIDPPVLSGVPDDVTISCFEPDFVDPVVTAFDTCDGALPVDVQMISDTSTSQCVGEDITRTHTYIFSAEDGCGNIARDTFVLSVRTDLVADLGPDREVCDGGEVELDAFTSPEVPDVEYEWSTGDITTTIIVGPGIYGLTVTSPGGCCAFDNIQVFGGADVFDLSVETTPVVEGGDGTATLTVDGGTPPYIIEWDNGEVGETAVMLSVGAHAVTVTDDDGCQESVAFNINRLTTVCDLQADYLTVGDEVQYTLGAATAALQSILGQSCVSDAYGLPLPDPLAMKSFLFYSQGAGVKNVEASLVAGPDENVRGFVFTCDCSGAFCVQSCVGDFDADNPFSFTGSEGYYYIAVLGDPGADVTLNVQDLASPDPTCPVDQVLTCGGVIIETLTGEDDFNTINPDKNIYSSCYNGGLGFTGPDHVYRLEITERTEVSFLAISGSARLGMFLYNYLCGESCIDSEVAPFAGSPVRMLVELTPGTYNLVLDQADHPIGQEVTLIANCTAVEGGDDIAELGLGFNSSSCPVDTTNQHLILFDLGSSMIGDRLMDNGDKIYMKRVDGRQAIPRSFSYNGTDAVPVKVPEDDPNDPEYCGYRVNDAFSITVDLKNGPVYNNVNAVYAAENGSSVTSQGSFEQNGQSLVTLLSTDPNAVGLNLLISPPFKNVLADSIETSFDVQSNQDWDVFKTSLGWISMVGIKSGDPDVMNGSGNKKMVVQFPPNPDCSPRRDTVRIQGRVSGEFKDFVVIQAGNPDLSGIDVDSDINADGSVTASATGGAPPYSYIWSTGDSTATTVDSLVNGTYYVTVTDANQCFTIQEVVVDVVGSRNLQFDELVTLVPNPTSGLVSIRFDMKSPTDVHITVYNPHGKVIRSLKSDRATEGDQLLDLTDVTPGIYLVCISAGAGSVNRRIIVQN